MLLLAAALIAASSRGASLTELRLIAVALVALIAVVLGFSWFQVKTGHWGHIDASGRKERESLNMVLASVLLLSALLLWALNREPPLPVGIAMCGALVATALLIGRWVKMSLHTAFAIFATALMWPSKLACLAGIVISAAVIWSRLVLGRHVVADVVAGLLFGTAAGVGYQCWIV